MSRIWIVTTAALVAVVLALAACSEKDVPYVIDADEVTGYIKETTECKQLFAWENFILPTPYAVPSENAVYRDSLISHSRAFEAFLVPWKGHTSYDAVFANWGPLGRLREATVIVLDSFQVETVRQYATDTLVDTSWRTLQRSAFFLKFGDDTEEYAGWVMWGYNGAAGDFPDAVVRVRLYDNSEFSADGSMYLDGPKSPLGLGAIPFVRVDQLSQIVVGSRVVVRIARASSSPAAWDIISGMDTSGVFMRPMITRDTLSVDTIRAPHRSQNPPQYGLYYVQTFRTSNSRLLQSYCIPFKM